MKRRGTKVRPLATKGAASSRRGVPSTRTSSRPTVRRTWRSPAARAFRCCSSRRAAARAASRSPASTAASSSASAPARAWYPSGPRTRWARSSTVLRKRVASNKPLLQPKVGLVANRDDPKWTTHPRSSPVQFWCDGPPFGARAPSSPQPLASNPMRSPTNPRIILFSVNPHPPTRPPRAVFAHSNPPTRRSTSHFCTPTPVPHRPSLHSAPPPAGAPAPRPSDPNPPVAASGPNTTSQGGGGPGGWAAPQLPDERHPLWRPCDPARGVHHRRRPAPGRPGGALRGRGVPGHPARHRPRRRPPSGRGRPAGGGQPAAGGPHRGWCW